MHDILKEIIKAKHKEISRLKKSGLEITNRDKCEPNDSLNRFKDALSGDGLSFIGEIKRRSPSKGLLSPILQPLSLLQHYVDGGVSAVSVLTDKDFFSGSMDDLRKVVNHLEGQCVPVLRKDFILDESQVVEAKLAGASALLLIVALLKEKTKDLLSYANKLGLDVLVEVHNLEELNLAIEMGADIIGVNNRDLHTFKEDINVCLQLAPLIPSGILKVAESAIKSPSDIRAIRAAGFDAVLIGEALVTSKNPAETLQLMRSA